MRLAGLLIKNYKRTRLLRLMEQRDAIGLALDMASLDRQAVMREANYENAGSAMSALDLLDHEPLQEQDVIRQDQNVFETLLTPDMRSARFRGPGCREVRVYVYDKKPLEAVLGYRTRLQLPAASLR